MRYSQGLTREIIQHRGWVWAKTTEDERGRVRLRSTKQRENMIFECLIFLLSVVLRWWKYNPNLILSRSVLFIRFIICQVHDLYNFYQLRYSMVGNHNNITLITGIFLSSKLENLKNIFEARWGWNFFQGKSRVLRPRQSLVFRVDM